LPCISVGLDSNPKDLVSANNAYNGFPMSIQALLHSVPSGKMIVLDLFAEVKPIWQHSEQFYGTPYIWQVFL